MIDQMLADDRPGSVSRKLNNFDSSERVHRKAFSSQLPAISLRVVA